MATYNEIRVVNLIHQKSNLQNQSQNERSKNKKKNKTKMEKEMYI